MDFIHKKKKYMNTQLFFKTIIIKTIIYNRHLNIVIFMII